LKKEWKELPEFKEAIRQAQKLLNHPNGSEAHFMPEEESRRIA
jgi:hypothetical protein